MDYDSIDNLQKALASEMFHHAADAKKAAGRALGMLVEIISYHTLRAWNLSNHIVMERRVPEFANPDITHNVEFSLHRLISRHEARIDFPALPITASKVVKYFPHLHDYKFGKVNILEKSGVKRNSAVIAKTATGPFVVANIDILNGRACKATICELHREPFAIVECKRVGVQEGLKKGPQTIEKAKQGSYVARSVSSLQKIRMRDGGFLGIMEMPDGELRTGPYAEMRRDIILSPSHSNDLGFVLTIGVVSNHGNWFTSKMRNKETHVLAQSYDWLLFLADEGLAMFIDTLLLNPTKAFLPVSNAFKQSYSQNNKPNRFTKVLMDIAADSLLRKYFSDNLESIQTWFNVISPEKATVDDLLTDLGLLSGRKEVD